MTAFLPGVPEPGEYHPAFVGYVEKARRFADPVAALATQGDDFLALLRTLPAEKRLYRYARGKWSVQQLLGHITDAERVFAYRALRIGRADQTPLPGFDENPWAMAAEAERCDWGELIEEFAMVRRATILLLRHFPEAAWMRSAVVNGAPLSVRALAYILHGHVEHHIDILRERYL